MRPIVKILCCGLALMWLQGAVAGTTGQAPVKPHYVKKWDRPGVEKRITDQSTLTQKRKVQAKKSAPRSAPAK